jgi:DNA-binding GntR family transcriptional regulator
MGHRVYAVLRERILDGELAPGARLHQEGLAEDLGVSRTPLREALGRLAADGLVDLLPNRGARVADVGPDDMHVAYEARLVVEPAAAARAAGRRDPAADAAMRAAIAEHRASVDDFSAAFDANRAFHLALVRAAGNPYLDRFAESLWVARVGLRVYQAQREPPEFILADADEHEAIADAVAAGDVDRAQELTRRHITAAMALLREQLAADAS